MSEPEKTLREMALESLEMEISAGRGICCPTCGCRDLRNYGNRNLTESTLRYKQCRHCGEKILTIQPPERILRRVGDD
jgi:DNA-directed RNA polymerase subunit RPC12/RpoP